MGTQKKDETLEKEGKEEEKSSIFKRIQATMCHHCPLCSHARKNPDSTVGKIFHHRYHADNCSLWKAEKDLYGEN